MRLVFFGTPAFAVPSLEALRTAGHVIPLVVTQPDRPQGRSRSVLVPPPVKTAALAHGLEVVQPEKPLGDLFLAALRRADADAAVVVAYGHLLRPAVLAVPRLGMLNVHASLLPALRGAAPVAWALLHGLPETGVSIMQMAAGMDTGPVYERVPTPITADDTAGTLGERLAVLGARALVRVLAQLEQGGVVPEPQDDAAATLAPKLDRALARIPWDEPATRVANRIRAMDPAPGAWSTLGAAEVKLYGAHPAAGQGAPGTIIAAGSDGLTVAAGEGAVTIRELQQAGRKRLPVRDWLLGRPSPVGARFR